MTTFVIALSIWLHTLATVVFVGHYLFMSLVYLPVFEQQAKGNALRELLEEVSGRLRPYFGGSLLIFIITGTYLMVINEDYLGLGDFFGNAWSVLIVVKHVIVLAFLALAIYSERAIMGKISDAQPQALRQFRLVLGVNTTLGILILLLTTAAQSV
ncbi:MAG: hypothetical protein A2W35_04055 [Chloroflexi bacterium RBG_16_57_11]|jgi:uncharacterized membrane protein|nr:MAG: hypothetical protein A2W35_04055 [Chloroflexi bacterium RBG_16_57_11]